MEHVWVCPLRWCDYQVVTESRGRMLVHRVEHLRSARHREFLEAARADLGVHGA